MAAQGAKQMTTTKKTMKATTISLTGVQPEKPFRASSARGLYYKDLVARVGKDTILAEELAKVWGDAKTAPKLPKSGKVEPPAGWVAYFVRIGVAKLGSTQVQAS